MKYILFILFFSMIVFQSKAAPGAVSAFKYWFIIDKCSTGKHKFNTKIEMCEALQNDKLNNGCSLVLRQDEFKKINCEGAFKATNEFDNSNKEKILCSGVISNDYQEFQIEREIYWDKNYSQRFNIVEYNQIQTVGTVVLDLKKPEKNHIGEMRLATAFLDNNKYLSITGGLESTLRLKQTDKRYLNRRLDLICKSVSREKDLSDNFKKNEDTICFGNRKQQGVNLKSLSALIHDGNKDRIIVDKSPLFSIHKNQDEFRVVNQPLEDVVEVSIEVNNSHFLDYKYLSAWDGLEVNWNCVPKSFLSEALKSDDHQKKEK